MLDKEKRPTRHEAGPEAEGEREERPVKSVTGNVELRYRIEQRRIGCG